MQVNANELTNGVINAAFMLLFKDVIRLFAAYNEGIINLLEKYFDMKKAQCKEGLDIYKKFLTRMMRISEFLKVAEQVGIDRGDIPDLSQAPSSLLDALEQHLASLEGKKVKDSTAASRASTLSNAVSSLANTGISFTKVDEREKQAALEEEQARLKALKEQRLMELSKKPSTTAASPVSTVTISSTPAIDLFSTPSSFTNCTPKVPNDLLDLQPTFQPSLPLSTGLPLANTWGGFPAPPAAQPPSSTGLNVNFDSVFGNKSATNSTDSADDVLGGILKPTVASPNQGLTPSAQQPGKLVSDDLDSSLANLVGNLCIGNGTTKNDIHWSHPGEKKLTGGNNWQPKMAPTTTWNPATMVRTTICAFSDSNETRLVLETTWDKQDGMLFPQYAPSVMAFPATTPTGMMGYAMPPQMGSMTMMTQPTMMYTQPVMRPANPFGQVSGAQV
ncbi:hypothetical protein cypCar_00016557 [Cyprinus carpio]|nr:hypothetical protein cypCar_00016557 [Cyprinus carpio]